jgi:hypothetical protein
VQHHVLGQRPDAVFRGGQPDDLEHLRRGLLA